MIYPQSLPPVDASTTVGLVKTLQSIHKLCEFGIYEDVHANTEGWKAIIRILADSKGRPELRQMVIDAVQNIKTDCWKHLLKLYSDGNSEHCIKMIGFFSKFYLSNLNSLVKYHAVHLTDKISIEAIFGAVAICRYSSF